MDKENKLWDSEKGLTPNIVRSVLSVTLTESCMSEEWSSTEVY